MVRHIRSIFFIRARFILNQGGAYICTFLAGKNGTIIYGGFCLLCVFVRYYFFICFTDGAKMKE